MKLHAHPASTTSRTVMMFCAHTDIPVENETVDIFSGAHTQEPFASFNPNKLVPVLEDDGFRLTESSAILKYLADKFDSPLYPKDLQKRARVNEMMDWLNTQAYREIAYHLTYPQLFDNLKRPTEEENKSIVAWGKTQAKNWLTILDQHHLGDGRQYLTGDDLTIADFLGAELIGCADLIHVDWSAYPNVERWLNRMKSLPKWGEVHEVFDGFCASTAEGDWVKLD